MAKSIRSKTKRAFRSKKREAGIYAATEAARLHRLNSKLKTLTNEDSLEEGMEADPTDESLAKGEDSMVLDTPGESVKPISTHGRRLSRREEWRVSKGMPTRSNRQGTNRQGGPSARRKAGRAKRRR